MASRRRSPSAREIGWTRGGPLVARMDPWVSVPAVGERSHLGARKGHGGGSAWQCRTNKALLLADGKGCGMDRPPSAVVPRRQAPLHRWMRASSMGGINLRACSEGVLLDECACRLIVERRRVTGSCGKSNSAFPAGGPYEWCRGASKQPADGQQERLAFGDSDTPRQRGQWGIGAREEEHQVSRLGRLAGHVKVENSGKGWRWPRSIRTAWGSKHPRHPTHCPRPT